MTLLWCFLFTFGLVLVAVTKIAFVGWGIGIQSLDFTGFSGHAMRATAVMPVLFYLLLQKAPPLARLSGVILGFALGVIIGISRLVVHAHSVSEAVTGCLVGGMVALSFFWLSRSLPKPELHRWLIVLTLIPVFLTAQAKPAPTERWLNGVALYISGHDKPFARTDWE
ncbi:phosphatase PAP2 family protein [Collimonas antrihumi]|uniref:phosphatase PAP2 family protein n=1 Tax=Collimonas antrihumi TaxID=1940615 RepID=UPI001FE7FF8D|nr:phosphatase PAP2 family protein [Collimonas antrihumi]